MRRKIILALFAVLAVGIGPLSSPAAAQSDMQAAKEVMAIARAQWAAEIAKAPVAEAMKNVADEYTQFDRETPTRLDGKALIMRFAEGTQSGSGALITADMVNPKVQVYGDVAILSYNFVGQVRDQDGVVEPTLAKSTRVYVRQNGSWMLVHANFAPVGN